MRFCQLQAKLYYKIKGHISHQQMQAKVLSEYQKYQNQTISPVERDYLREIRVLDTYVKKGGK